MRSLSTCLTIAILTAASVAQAQNCSTGGSRPTGQHGKKHAIAGPCIAGHVHHSATAAESYGRGKAATIQAQAYYNIMTSHAMINAAEAQQIQIENKQKQVETYFALRDAYKARRAAELAETRSKGSSVTGSQTGRSGATLLAGSK